MDLVVGDPAAWDVEQADRILVLRFGVPRSEIEEIRVYDEHGNLLELSSWGSADGGAEFESVFLREEKPLPRRGRVVLVVHDNVELFEIPFAIRNIDLLGREAR